MEFENWLCAPVWHEGEQRIKNNSRVLAWRTYRDGEAFNGKREEGTALKGKLQFWACRIWNLFGLLKERHLVYGWRCRSETLELSLQNKETKEDTDTRSLWICKVKKPNDGTLHCHAYGSDGGHNQWQRHWGVIGEAGWEWYENQWRRIFQGGESQCGRKVIISKKWTMSTNEKVTGVFNMNNCRG